MFQSIRNEPPFLELSLYVKKHTAAAGKLALFLKGEPLKGEPNPGCPQNVGHVQVF